MVSGGGARCRRYLRGWGVMALQEAGRHLYRRTMSDVFDFNRFGCIRDIGLGLHWDQEVFAGSPVAGGEIVDPALAQLSRAFDKLYTQEGRPSIPLERPLRAVAPSLLYDSESVLCLKCWLG